MDYLQKSQTSILVSKILSYVYITKTNFLAFFKNNTEALYIWAFKGTKLLLIPFLNALTKIDEQRSPVSDRSI